MSYRVKEVFATLQGEGANVGRPAVFCRFTGCNLWTGREEQRADAICRFCDTDFVGTSGVNGGKFRAAADLAAHVRAIWEAEAGPARPAYVVCTGGEPLLQLDAPLITALKAEGFEIGVETNGTIAAPEGLDWICVSPKANAPLVQTRGNELKLVYPQDEPEAQPERFSQLDFSHFFLQPKDDPNAARNLQGATTYCMKNPQWRLSLQTHKLIGLP